MVTAHECDGAARGSDAADSHPPRIGARMRRSGLFRDGGTGTDARGRVAASGSTIRAGSLGATNAARRPGGIATRWVLRPDGALDRRVDRASKSGLAGQTGTCAERSGQCRCRLAAQPEHRHRARALRDCRERRPRLPCRRRSAVPCERACRRRQPRCSIGRKMSGARVDFRNANRTR